MKIIRHPSSVPDAVTGSAVAIGNFDGVHPGHQAVINEAGRLARAENRPWTVFTFEPHPRRVFQPGAEPFRLTPFHAKARAIETLGVDYLFVQRFSRSFSQTPAEDFVRETLSKGVGAGHVVAGYDFVFGKGRGGNCELLLRMGAELGFGVTAVAAHGDEGGERYSSTRVREALAAGDVETAAQLLGRDYGVTARVRHGDQRGRTIGFPTANMRLGDHLVPARGVYAVEADIPGRGAPVPGVANLGRRPTFGGAEDRLETFLFDFSGDLYGERLHVRLKHFIRGEKKFDGMDALKAQIAADSAKARELLIVE